MDEGLEFVGRDDVSERSLFLLHIPSLESIPAQIKLESRYFICFLASDATAISDETVRSAAKDLLRSGAAFVAAWGEDCEKVHDLVDQAAIEIDPDPTDESVIMTTWHDSKSLQDALWFALNAAFPAEQYFDECRSLLAVVVGLPSVAAAIRVAFADARAFSRKVLEDQE